MRRVFEAVVEAAGIWVLAGGLVACGEPEAPVPEGTCRTAMWGKSTRSGSTLSVTGSWDDWSEPVAMHERGDGWQLAQIDLPPGVYGYQIVEEGRGRLDPYNPSTTFRSVDAQEVSRVVVDDCSVPRIEVSSIVALGPDGYELRLQVRPAADGEGLDPASVVAEDEHGHLEVVAADPDEGTLVVRASSRPAGKAHARIEARDAQGRVTPERTIAAWVDPVAVRWDDGIVYQIMIDRFRGDAGVALEPPANPGARAGGTLDGVRAELEAGTFERLGVSALWLSPVYVNPVEAREGRFDGHLYEGYHGYWPLDSRAVDDRIGGEAGLHALVEAAHARGIRVLLDLVPNHLYEANPRVAEHRADGWFNEHDPPCVCGSPTCPWSEFIGTCWFTDYLPDLRLQQADAMDSIVDDATWWLSTFDVDGFRIDAVPMMPRAATRRIVAGIRAEAGTADVAFAMGEIFTGGGPEGTADIRYYMGPDGLDSAFDFPLMWALREAIAAQGSGFAAVEASLAETDRALEGSGAIVGRMIGNHDVTRFASESVGDAGGDPWAEPPAQSIDPDVLARQRLALGLVLTLPGLPVVYYGDELALAGASDPDNRRVMPAVAELAAGQVALVADVQRLAQLRRCLPALRRGERRALRAEDDTWAFVRDAGDGAPVVVVASRADAPRQVDLGAIAGMPDGWYQDALEGDMVQLGAATAATLPMTARGLRVLVPAGNACLVP